MFKFWARQKSSMIIYLIIYLWSQIIKGHIWCNLIGKTCQTPVVMFSWSLNQYRLVRKPLVIFHNFSSTWELYQTSLLQDPYFLIRLTTKKEWHLVPRAFKDYSVVTYSVAGPKESPYSALNPSVSNSGGRKKGALGANGLI